jgi:hypothetical protein
MWSFIRIYLLPGLSLLLPILTLIAPYFILAFVFKLPITFGNYMSLLQAMLSGQMETVMNPQAINQPVSFSPINLLKQFGVVAVSLVQGVIQPYWTYKHLNSIDTIIQDNGKLIIRLKEIYQQIESLLASHGITFFKCPLPTIMNERDATARIMLESVYFKMALKYLGSLEVILCLANQKEVHPVTWVSSSTPVFSIRDTFDFQVPSSTRKCISADCTTKPHSLLTGPNKGGKSTVLRALSVSALLAHTYGCSIGHLTATPFERIFVCLKPDDLYHSTNPPDALRSCEIYCKQLWEKPNVVSVISTHLFELVEQAPEAIQRLCCPAVIDSTGIIHFSYQLQNGICKVSSVDTLLHKNGLMRA